MVPSGGKDGNRMVLIRAERKARGWTVAGMARKLRDAADNPKDVPGIEALMHNIYRWERGGFGVSERYRNLYCRVFQRTEFELFGIEPPEIVTEVLTAASASENPASGVTTEDSSGNQYLVLVLPRGSQRVVIEITSTEERNELEATSQPISRLALVKEPASRANP
jgi:hypothetical protein